MKAFFYLDNRVLARGVSLVLLASTSLEAQETFERIRPDARLRITAPQVAASRLVGTAASVDSIGIGLRVDRKDGVAYYREGPEGLVPFEPPPRMVPWVTITQLEVGQTVCSGKRAAAGAGIGLLAGIVVGGLIGFASSTDHNVLRPNPAAFVATLVLGGSGLLLGTVIGALPHEQWETMPLSKDRSP